MDPQGDELFPDLYERLTDQDSRKAVLTAIGESVLEGMRQNILTSGHGAWAPLAESTIAAKMLGGYPLLPLVRTRDLISSLYAGGPNDVLEVQGDSVSAGTAVEYAEYHVTGGDHLPRRDFSELTDDTLGAIHDAAARWVSGDL